MSSELPEMSFFGEPWGAPLLESLARREVPVGAVCVWCSETIADDDQGIVYSNGPVAHDECFERKATGGVNHILGRCFCCGGDEPPDPPEMTIRQAAQAAVQLNSSGGVRR